MTSIYLGLTVSSYFRSVGFSGKTLPDGGAVPESPSGHVDIIKTNNRDARRESSIVWRHTSRSTKQDIEHSSQFNIISVSVMYNSDIADTKSGKNCNV